MQCHPDDPDHVGELGARSTRAPIASDTGMLMLWLGAAAMLWLGAAAEPPLHTLVRVRVSVRSHPHRRLRHLVAATLVTTYAPFRATLALA